MPLLFATVQYTWQNSYNYQTRPKEQSFAMIQAGDT